MLLLDNKPQDINCLQLVLIVKTAVFTVTAALSARFWCLCYGYEICSGAAVSASFGRS